MREKTKVPSDKDKAAAAEGTGTVNRVIRMLGAIAAAPAHVGVGELASELSLPVPTIHRLLHLLRQNGMVEWHAAAHKYSIGPELYRISALVLGNATVPQIAQREIEVVSAKAQETVLFGMYQAGSAAMSFAAKAEGDHPLQYRIQMHVPLSLVWGASGKAILAYLPEDEVARALAREQDRAQNGAVPPGLEQLLQDLERVRRNGYSVSEGEKLLGARGIAAPVFNQNGIIGCVCMTSPKERIPIDRIAELGDMVRESAARLSDSLGAPRKPLRP